MSAVLGPNDAPLTAEEIEFLLGDNGNPSTTPYLDHSPDIAIGIGIANPNVVAAAPNAASDQSLPSPNENAAVVIPGTATSEGALETAEVTVVATPTTAPTAVASPEPERVADDRATKERLPPGNPAGWKKFLSFRASGKPAGQETALPAEPTRPLERGRSRSFRLTRDHLLPRGGGSQAALRRNANRSVSPSRHPRGGSNQGTPPQLHMSGRVRRSTKNPSHPPEQPLPTAAASSDNNDNNNNSASVAVAVAVEASAEESEQVFLEDFDEEYHLHNSLLHPLIPADSTAGSVTTASESETNEPAVVTATYEGPVNEYGEKQGFGEMHWSNGDHYRGRFFNGLRHGPGTLSFRDGSEYVGDWECNQMHGRGTRRFANGDAYTGQYFNGQRQGEGRFYFANGDLYVGHWAGDAMAGFGRYYYHHGQRFEGLFDKGVRHGRGKLQRLDGSLDIFHYHENVRVDPGVRWSADRKAAWKLTRQGKTVRRIPIAQAVSLSYQIENPVEDLAPAAQLV